VELPSIEKLEGCQHVVVGRPPSSLEMDNALNWKVTKESGSREAVEFCS
jgi:hypothetical protein